MATELSDAPCKTTLLVLRLLPLDCGISASLAVEAAQWGRGVEALLGGTRESSLSGAFPVRVRRGSCRRAKQAAEAHRHGLQL